MSESRTSLRLSSARSKKLKELKSAWGFPSNDEVVGFLIDIGDAEKMGAAAGKHLGRLKAADARERLRKQQVERVMNSMSPEQIDQLIANGGVK